MQAKLWTVNALSVELDRDRRSLSRLLEGLEPDKVEQAATGESRLYRMSRVFAHLMNDSEETPKDRLTRLQADKTQLEVDVLRGELISRSVAKLHWAAMVASMRSLLLVLPSKAAPQLAGDPGRVAGVQEILHALVCEALDEIAGDCFPDEVRRRFNDAVTGGEVAAEPHNQSVGGPEPETEQRGKRGAGALEDKSSGIPTRHNGRGQ